MRIFKNLHLLTNVNDEAKLWMDEAAQSHAIHNSLSFKIVDASMDQVTIQVVQEKNANGKYFDQRRLIEIVHESFDRFFKGMRVLVHPVAFAGSPADSVDPVWIKKMMIDLGIKLKTMAAETGIDYTRLSALVNGDRPLSNVSKAMFYYYFRFKETK